MSKTTSEEIVFFKLRFKPLNLFYKPASGYESKKMNLSKKGKAYTYKALHFSMVNRIYVPKDTLPDRLDTRRSDIPTWYKNKVVNTVKEDWEWVKFESIETEVLPIA